MSVNDHQRFGGFGPDPFVCPQFEVLEDSWSTRSWSSSSSTDFARFCPSSAPNSPDSFVYSPVNLPYSDFGYIKEEPYYLENSSCFFQQPYGFPSFKQESSKDPYYPVFLERLSSVTSAEDFGSPVEEFSEPDLDERYEDFVELVYEKPSLFGYREVELKMETDESNVKDSPDDGSPQEKRSQKSRKPRKSSISPVAQAPLSPSLSSDYSGSGGSQSSSSSGTSMSGDERSSFSKSRKRKSPGSKSPGSDRSSECNSNSYVRRREKNNIAVRKSREKKREEAKRFNDEHRKLKREVDDVRSQNDKLKSLLAQVEEGLLDDSMSREQLAGLVTAAKLQVNSL